MAPSPIYFNHIAFDLYLIKTIKFLINTIATNIFLIIIYQNHTVENCGGWWITK